MHREYHKWFSANLDRDMEMLIFGHAGARVLVFPTRHGRFHDYEDFGMVGALTKHLENGWLQLFCVDSVDQESVYNLEAPPQYRIRRHIQYERYIIDEVLPFTRLKNPQPFMIAHGCSLGAFHAVNIAFKYPQYFGKVVALSGRYDLSLPVAEFRSLFDDYYDEDIYYNTPTHYIPNLTDETILAELRRLEITIVIGAQDPFIGSNIALSEIMTRKRIPHKFYVWHGRAHKAYYWQKMVQLYL